MPLLLQLFSVVRIFLRFLGVISEGHKNYFKGLLPHRLAIYLLMFNLFKLNELSVYYQKHVNQIILNCITNIAGVRSNFSDCGSFLESNSSEILALCAKFWMTQKILVISP